MRNNTHNYIAKTAIDYANIQPEEIMDICLREKGAIVEVDFNTEWMNYSCYVDLSGTGSASSPSLCPSTIPTRWCSTSRTAAVRN